MSKTAGRVTLAVTAWWMCSTAWAQPDPGAAPDALPGVSRVGHVGEAPPQLSLAGTFGYGVIESDAVDMGAHHRLLGDLALGVRPISWLAFAAGVRGRYDAHPADANGSDDSAVGQWWLAARAGGGLGGGFSLGGEARLDVLGGDAPDLALLGSALSLRAMATFTPEGSPLTLSLNAGYRFDGSGTTLDRTRPPLRHGDRVSLGISDSDALLFGLGASVDLRPLEIVGELSWEPWVESGAPDLGRAPLRIAAGARAYPLDELAVSLLVELTLQPRASVELTDPVVPVEPRFAALLSLAWRPRFGPSEARPIEDDSDLAAGHVEVQGEVRGADGAPLAGATVTATPEEGEPVHATTDAEGRYTLSGLRPGRWSVEVRAEGFAPRQETLQIADSGPAPAPGAIVLSPAEVRGALRAIVRDFRGRVVSGAEVFVDEERLGATDEDGVFTVEVSPGHHLVRVTAEGFREQETAVEIEPNGVTVLNADLRREN